MIIHVIIVLKGVIYELRFLFSENTKGEFIIDIVNPKVSTLIEIIFFIKNSDSLSYKIAI